MEREYEIPHKVGIDSQIKTIMPVRAILHIYEYNTKNSETVSDRSDKKIAESDDQGSIE